MPPPVGTAPRRFPRPVAAAALALWAVVVVAGFGFLIGYGGRAGAQGEAPEAWPADSALDRVAPLELLVFVHPLCPCTQASLETLDRTLCRAGRPVRIRAVAVGAREGNERVVERAARLPGATIVDDPAGDEARRFGAATSGHVLLYARGELVFSGGVTPARGHEGSSSGCEELCAALEGSLGAPAYRPVFGCGLFDPTPEGASAPRGAP